MVCHTLAERPDLISDAKVEREKELATARSGAKRSVFGQGANVEKLRPFTRLNIVRSLDTSNRDSH